MAELLLEVGTEEIPDWMIKPACGHLERNLLQALEEAGLQQDVTCEVHATPRRLALVASSLAESQADKTERLTGPPKKIAFDDHGEPTKAGLGFAKRAGLAIEDLDVGDDGRLFVEKGVKGRATLEILGEALPDVILGVHFPKTMYWIGKTDARFIRPIRWLVALLDGEVVPFEIAGVASGYRTFGHRRLGVGDLDVSGWSDYQEKLRENYVLLSADDRRKKIEQGIAGLLTNGLRVRRNPRLLEALVYLTEYPTPVAGDFEKEYLDLPEEVLETVMQHHQRYFAVEDSAGRLQPRFIAVANLDADPDNIIRQGHERVLRARFNDGRFFWETDQKRLLADRVADLKGVVFHAKLGTYFDKTERNQKLAGRIAEAAGLDEQQVAQAKRAAELAKCDLTTEMVGEFPELQGVIGGLYAAHQREPQEVADAVYDHYRPAGADDKIPRSKVGLVVALADKLDTLGGFFGAGMTPRGSRDPFALRRAAYGIIRILIEGKLHLSLDTLVEWAGAGESRRELLEFFLDRLRYYLRDVRGCRYDEVNAVLASSSEVPLDAAVRVDAIAKVRPTPDFEPLAVSFKRIKNILRQAGGVEHFSARTLDTNLLEGGVEADLYTAFEKLRPTVAKRKKDGEYSEALTAIASLRPAVDRYFDDVLVMAEDEAVKQNRLTLLAHLLGEFSTIADFAEIVSA